MATSTVNTSGIHKAAQRLEEDIRCRGLCVGDPYMTSSEAAGMLGVSVSTAQRALRLLANSQLLLRRPRHGTVIGPRAGRRRKTAIRTVHILVPEQYRDFHTVCDYRMVEAIGREVTGTNVQFTFLPEQGGLEYLKELITGVQSSAELVGVVAASCSRDVYQFLAETELPTVVCGSLYPGDARLPSLDSDFRTTGRLLVEYFVRRGHRRFALINPGEGAPGDNDLLHGLTEAMTTENLPPSALTVRFVPHEARTLSGAVAELLTLPDPPNAYIVTRRRSADIVSAALAEHGFGSSGEAEVVVQEWHGERGEDSPYTEVHPDMTLDEFATLIGRMLRQQVDGRPLEEDRVVLPVKLRQAVRDSNNAAKSKRAVPARPE